MNLKNKNIVNSFIKSGKGKPDNIFADFVGQMYKDTQTNSMYIALTYGENSIWKQMTGSSEGTVGDTSDSYLIIREKRGEE